MDAPRSKQAISPPLICVVDDDVSVRHALSNLFESAGYASISFDSAEACLASPRRADFVFAVLDVELGGINGFDLQQQLTADAPLPLVFLSAHGDQLAERRALDAGAIAFLLKPIEIDRLLAHIVGAVPAPGGAA